MYNLSPFCKSDFANVRTSSRVNRLTLLTEMEQTMGDSSVDKLRTTNATTNAWIAIALLAAVFALHNLTYTRGVKLPNAPIVGAKWWWEPLFITKYRYNTNGWQIIHDGYTKVLAFLARATLLHDVHDVHELTAENSTRTHLLPLCGPNPSSRCCRRNTCTSFAMSLSRSCTPSRRSRM